MILIAANSLKPFAYESIQILGLPNGSVFRARFPAQWVEKKLLEQPQNLVGSQLLYASRIWETDEVLPLRYATITFAKKIGRILFLEYELGRLVSYSSELQEQKGQIQAFRQNLNSQLVEIADSKSAPNGAMQPLVIDVDEKKILLGFQSAKFTSPDDQMKWMNAVDLLGRYEIYNPLPFYKLELYKKKTRTEVHLEDGKIALDSGEIYFLSVIHLVPDREHVSSTKSRTPTTPYMEFGPYDLAATTDQGNVSVTPKELALSGTYDKFDFEISAPARKSISDKLRLTFSVPGDISKSYRPIFEIPITIKPTLKGLMLRILGLLALSIIWLVLNFEDDIRDLLRPDVADYLGQFSLVFFALTCVEFVKYIAHLLEFE